MNLQRRLHHGIRVFLKHTVNRLTRRLAGRSFGPFAIIRHVGRRSGKPYETPIIVQPADDGFVIELTYGPDVDWYKNILAAGGCTVFWHGKDYIINKIEPMDTETGKAAFPLPQRLILQALRRRHFSKLLTQQR
jgi:deazaflavin-dependent oxidoreductase (nitroreductase family)